MTPILVSSSPNGTEERKWVSSSCICLLSPLSLDCVFSFDYFAFLVKLESSKGSPPERFNLLASPPRILSAYLTRFLPQLSVFPVGYFLDFAQIGRR